MSFPYEFKDLLMLSAYVNEVKVFARSIDVYDNQKLNLYTPTRMIH